jgi:FkbM family methyltransferase
MPKIEKSWDGFLWYVREGFRHDVIALTKREWSVMKLLTLLASKDKIFVEVGVHVGSYAIRMSKLYKHVIAIEPNPYSIECLKTNMELNKVQNMTVIPVACGDSDTELLLGLAEGSSSLLRKSSINTIVKVKRLDDLIGHVDVMKIDVEGYEEQVIRGGLNIINKCKPTMIIEHHDLGGYYNITGANIRIKNMLKNYRRFNLDGVRYAYVHEEQLPKLSKEVIGMLVTYHWFSRMMNNLREGRDWYYGLPYTWWYGMGVLDVIENLPEHVPEEPEWLEKIKND